MEEGGGGGWGRAYCRIYHDLEQCQKKTGLGLNNDNSRHPLVRAFALLLSLFNRREIEAHRL